MGPDVVGIQYCDPRSTVQNVCCIGPLVIGTLGRFNNNNQGDFNPNAYHDQYRDRLMGVIEAKQSGEGVKHAVEEKAPAAPDLLAALQASLDEVKTKPAPKSAAKSKAKATAGAGGGRAKATRGRRAG